VPLVIYIFSFFSQPELSICQVLTMIQENQKQRYKSDLDGPKSILKTGKEIRHLILNPVGNVQILSLVITAQIIFCFVVMMALRGLLVV
jgi:hypothetical protein